MKPKIKQQLRGYLEYFDLRVKYVRLPEKVSGFLQPGSDPRFIFLNEDKPHSDHVFTVAHELGHYVMHLARPARHKMPAYLDHPWESTVMREATQMTKSWVEPLLAPEGEADAWAFAFLLRIGAVDDLLTILELYPKKFWTFFLICMISTYKGLKTRTKNFFEELVDAFAGSNHQPRRSSRKTRGRRLHYF